MDIALIVSKNDLAGMNIKDKLITQCGFVETDKLFDKTAIYQHGSTRLYTLNNEHITREGLDKEILADFFIFATKHRSESGAKSLCVHAPGNWDKAEMGGKDKTLCVAPAQLMGALLRRLESHNLAGFDVVLEATHHGPSMNKPVCFIEIGSNETEWTDEKAGLVVAESIVEGIKAYKDTREFSKTALGIGGPHYCPNFKKLIIESRYAIGHVAPKYALEHLDDNMIKQAITKTHPQCDIILIDWKGLGGHKERIISLLDKNKIEYKRIN